MNVSIDLAISGHHGSIFEGLIDWQATSEQAEAIPEIPMSQWPSDMRARNKARWDAYQERQEQRQAEIIRLKAS